MFSSHSVLFTLVYCAAFCAQVDCSYMNFDSDFRSGEQNNVDFGEEQYENWGGQEGYHGRPITNDDIYKRIMALAQRNNELTRQVNNMPKMIRKACKAATKAQGGMIGGQAVVGGPGGVLILGNSDSSSSSSESAAGGARRRSRGSRKKSVHILQNPNGDGTGPNLMKCRCDACKVRAVL